jgi:hypothetical protein
MLHFKKTMPDGMVSCDFVLSETYCFFLNKPDNPFTGF